MVLLAIAALSNNAFSMMLGGDVMLNGISPTQKPFEKVVSLLKPASVAILNLEIPLTNGTASTPYKTAAELNKRTQYILKADPNHAPGLAATGVDIVSLGNNHCMDYRAAGMVQMKTILSKFGVAYAGAGQSTADALGLTVYKTANGKRIGLISALAFVSAGGLGKCTPATESRAGVATFSFGGVIDDIARKYLADLFAASREQCDVLVVGLHWGIEKQTLPSSYQVALGRACIDAGADVVWGNHPHVLQGAEVYSGKPILYSMGNFVSPRGGDTGLVKLVYEGTRFERALFYPCQIGGGKVSPVSGVAGQAKVKQFAGLCRLLLKRYPSKKSRPLFGFTP